MTGRANTSKWYLFSWKQDNIYIIIECPCASCNASLRDPGGEIGQQTNMTTGSDPCQTMLKATCMCRAEVHGRTGLFRNIYWVEYLKGVEYIGTKITCKNYLRSYIYLKSPKNSYCVQIILLTTSDLKRLSCCYAGIPHGRWYTKGRTPYNSLNKLLEKTLQIKCMGCGGGYTWGNQFLRKHAWLNNQQTISINLNNKKT